MKAENENQGLATYFRNVARNYLMARCKEHGYDLWESGLKIYTTLDSRMQKYANQAVRDHLEYFQPVFSSSWSWRGKEKISAAT